MNDINPADIHKQRVADILGKKKGSAGEQKMLVFMGLQVRQVFRFVKERPSPVFVGPLPHFPGPYIKTGHFTFTYYDPNLGTAEYQSMLMERVELWTESIR